MNKLISLVLLVGGIVLIVVGINATNSFSSDVSRFFTGSPTDKAVWMLIGGAIAAIIGLAGTLRGSKQSNHRPGHDGGDNRSGNIFPHPTTSNCFRDR